MKTRKLRKITVFVTERCNLQCKYCYVNTPTASVREEWSASSAADVVNRLLDTSHECAMIQFFGGEPSLRPDIIEDVIRRVETRQDSGMLAKLPRFAMVTNGVFPNRTRLIELIKEWDIEVTVSLDGHRKIHDVLRPKAGQTRGSYDDAIQTIEAMKKHDLPFNVESVYTTHHLEMGFGIRDLLKMSHRLGARTHYFEPAYPPAPEELVPVSIECIQALVDTYVEGIDYWLDRALNDREFVVRTSFTDILSWLLKGQPAKTSVGCPAGVIDAAVSSDGSVYPCPLFFGSSELATEADKLFERANEYDWLNDTSWPPESCRACECRFWCRMCPAMNLRWGNIHEPNPLECRLHKAIVLRIARRADELGLVPHNAYTKPLLESVLL